MSEGFGWPGFSEPDVDELVRTSAYRLAERGANVSFLSIPLHKATLIPSIDAPREEKVARALETNLNTSPFDVTGHPAMSLPCGRSNGLPVGMMLVGRRWDDATVLQAAHAFEQISGYIVHPDEMKLNESYA